MVAGGSVLILYRVFCMDVRFPLSIATMLEFGLRQQKETLTLPGVQVWHETYEYRENPIIIYYDIRNALVVNALWGQAEENGEEFIQKWKERLTEFHNNQRQDLKYLCTLAMWHFCSGRIFRISRGKIPPLWVWLSKKEAILKCVTPAFHRIRKKGEKPIFAYYKKV